MGSSASQARVPPATVHFTGLRDSLPRMDGKNVAITGCTSGTGLVLARTCGALGARVFALNRDSERSRAAHQELVDMKVNVVSVPCDLQSFQSVREAAISVAEQCNDGLDVLCNNAGVMGLPDQATGDGFDVQMQTNHLSHFLLTSLLWPQLSKAASSRGQARVVNHSSGARKAPSGPLQEQYLGPNGGQLGGDGFPGIAKWRRYQQSKLANLLFTYALHKQHTKQATGLDIRSLCAHPGPTFTSLQGKVDSGFLDRMIINRTLSSAHSTEDGAMGITICSCQPDVRSADFYGPAGSGKAGPAVLMEPERDAEQEQLLWDKSLEATGIKNFFAA